MAASVPRYLRQNRLGYLPLSSIVGSRLLKGRNGANLVFDIIMLPVNEFQRMKTNVGMQHVSAPVLNAGPGMMPSFMLTDAKEVIVPAGEADPERFAKEYFMKVFGLLNPEEPARAELPVLEKKPQEED